MKDRAVKGVCIGLLVVWAGLSRARLMDWQTDQTLWASAVAVAPTLRAQTNYASALIERGQWEAARPWIHTLMRSTDPKAPFLADALIHRAQFLGAPVCDDPELALFCA